MNEARRISWAAAISLTIALAVPPAKAAMIAGDTSSLSLLEGETQTLSYSGFDGSMGTLSKATFDFNSTWSASGVAQTGNCSSDADVPNVLGSWVKSVESPVDVTQNTTITGTGTCDTSLSLGFLHYSDSGTFDAVVEVTDSSTLTGLSSPFSVNLSNQLNTSLAAQTDFMWDGDMSVSYTFSPAATKVPESGTLGLILVGSSALVINILNRRRNRQMELSRFSGQFQA